MSHPIPDGLVYLSLPYSSPEPKVLEDRMALFWEAAAALLSAGVQVVSPMSLIPAMVHMPGEKTDWAAWETYCKSLLDRCEEVWVLCLPGWDRSLGVGGEIQYANMTGKPVQYIDPKRQTISHEAPQ